MKYGNFSESVIGYIITRNLAELSQLTRYKIAGHFGINQTYLSKKFKKETNMTLSEFIEFEKMKRAEILLKSGHELSVETISQMVGFEKCAQFRRKFKKIYYLNPGQYRMTTVKSPADN
jgi:AraC-like DNA-binding protein